MVKLIQEKNSMKPIAHFEQRYLIAEDGTVINLANNTPLAWIKNQNGYFKVGLALGDGTLKQVSVHSLVAQHYIPNPYGYNQVNHKDGNKANNHMDNLEWCSAQQNIHHAFVTNLRPGYMSANDKEMYLGRVINGEQVADIANEIERHPNTLHKMLRVTADRVGKRKEWDITMKENRKNAAIRNLASINN